MSLSVQSLESSSPNLKERNLMASPSSFGRPLSMIESTGSSPDEEDLSAGSDLHQTGWSTQHTSPHKSTDLKTQINELIKMSNASLAADKDEKDFIRLKDLPKLLADFERVNGYAILNEEGRPVLNDNVQNNPDVQLNADSLIDVIKMLNKSRDDALLASPEGNGHLDEERDHWKEGRARRYSGTSESETDASTEDNQSHSDSDNNSSDRMGLKKGPSALSARHFEFPRSQSERLITVAPGHSGKKTLDNSTSSDRRKKTTSDPSAPSLEIRPRSISHSKSKAERQTNGEMVDRDVLRGKGKAKVPPSSWSNTRPRPPALARRSRRVSDISNNPSEDLEEDFIESSSPLPTSSSQYSQIGMGSPSEPSQRTSRQRILSQPETYKETSTGRLPRSASSASSGFVFPRAYAICGEEVSDNLNSDGWDHISGGQAPSPLPRSVSGASLPRNGSERAASPALDETSYQSFNALSPTMTNEYFGSAISPGIEAGRLTTRRSSAAGRRREAESEEGDETILTIDAASELRARLEATQRQLSEKERQHDAVQHEHELLISTLQDEVEEMKGQISTRKKEVKDSKARENSHLDSIATLEADLNKTEKTLETTRDQLTKAKVDYDDQIVETNRLRNKVSELQEELQRFKAEERFHSEAAKAWEGDREKYRKTIKKLHEEVDQVEANLSRLEEGERENRMLKEQMERMTVELEDVRRGSNVRGSHLGSEVDSTLSKRLGSELAREIAKGAARTDNADDIEEAEGMPESDESIDYVVREIRKIRKKDKVEGVVEGAPPPYNEAALEKQVSDRLHPSIDSDQQVEADIKDQSYHTMMQRTGMRCTVLEERLKVYEREHARSTETLLKEAASFSKDKWDDWVLHVWEVWTSLILTLLTALVSLFRFTTSTSKTEFSKDHKNAITFLTTSMVIFAVGLTIGWLFSSLPQGKQHLWELEDFGISDPLLFPETMFQEQASWFGRLFTLSNGRPLSRMPT